MKKDKRKRAGKAAIESIPIRVIEGQPAKRTESRNEPIPAYLIA